jgi:hypothetical protein
MNLYYSMKCPHSQSLIILIKENASLSKNIRGVCIDTHPFPPNLLNVPAIEYNQEMFVGKRAFDFIKASRSDNEENTRGVTDNSISGVELGSGFTFLGNESAGFRFDRNLTSSQITNDLSIPKPDDTKRSENDNTSGMNMDKLKLQRENEIELPMKRI